MAFTAFSAVRNSSNPDQIDVEWTHEGSADSFTVRSQDPDVGDSDSAESPFSYTVSRWFADTVSIIARDENWDEIESSESINIPADPPELIAPSVTATRDLYNQIRLFVTLPAFVATLPWQLNDKKKIHFQLTDLTGADHRTGSFNFYESAGVVEEYPYGSVDDELLPDHPYEISVAIAIDQSLSAWSVAVPVNQESSGDNSITRLELIYNPLANHGLDLEWAMSDPANPVNFEIETRIDGGEWKATANVISGAGSLLLHHQNQNDEFTEYLLDVAHGYGYQAGINHDVQARARIQGETDWITTTAVNLPLDTVLNAELIWPVVSYWYRRPNTFAELSLSVDGSPFVDLGLWPTGFNVVGGNFCNLWYIGDWADNRWYYDGNEHTVELKITERSNQFPAYQRESTFSKTGVFIMPAAPSNIVVSYRRVLNPFTRLQTGYEILATGATNVAGLKVSASIDGAPDVEGVFQALSPTMTKINGIEIPRDGLSHTVVVKFWIHDSVANEDSDPLLIPAFPAVFDLEPPALPTAVTATRLRDGNDAIPDQVLLAWESPDPVDIYVVDSLQKKRKVYSANTNESSVVLENSRRYGTQDGTAQSYKFGCAAFNRSVQSEIVYAAPITITAGEKEIAPPTPDEIAGTAEKMNQAQLVSQMATELPSVDSATISTVINALISKIKSVVALGGSVSLNDLGQFAAKWSEDKISSTGLLVPAARSGLFLESDGFTKGTKLGRVMSDTEAALLK